MFVYVIVCNESLKLYIGQHRGTNLRQYLQQKLSEARRGFAGRSHLYNAMRKYPQDTWSIWPLVSDIETRAELDEIEKHFIRILKTQHPAVGYNICRGGEGFTGPHSDAAKKKLSITSKRAWKLYPNKMRRGFETAHARFSTPNGRQNLSEMLANAWKNPEHRAKRIQAIKNSPGPTRFKAGHEWNPKSGAKGPNETSFKLGIVPWNKGTKGKTAANSGSFVKGHKLGVGRKFSTDHIKHLRESHLGQKAANKGGHHTEATRQKMRDAWIRRKARQAAL